MPYYTDLFDQMQKAAGRIHRNRHQSPDVSIPQAVAARGPRCRAVRAHRRAAATRPDSLPPVAAAARPGRPSAGAAWTHPCCGTGPATIGGSGRKPASGYGASASSTMVRQVRFKVSPISSTSSNTCRAVRSGCRGVDGIRDDRRNEGRTQRAAAPRRPGSIPIRPAPPSRKVLRASAPRARSQMPLGRAAPRERLAAPLRLRSAAGRLPPAPAAPAPVPGGDGSDTDSSAVTNRDAGPPTASGASKTRRRCWARSISVSRPRPAARFPVPSRPRRLDAAESPPASQRQRYQRRVRLSPSPLLRRHGDPGAVSPRHALRIRGGAVSSTKNATVISRSTIAAKLDVV